MRNFLLFIILAAKILTLSIQSFADESNDSESFSIERSFVPEVSITAELNKSTVRCLEGDYGASSLKISLPELRNYTVFQHTTRGETEPCINAGACVSPDQPNGLSPGSILDPKKPTEEIKLSIRLIETLTLNHTNKTCDSYLTETVKSVVRGLPFTHVEHRYIGSIGYERCINLKK